MPTVEAHSFVTLHYRLADAQGRDVINTFAERPATLSLGSGELAPALEACLVGLEEGSHRVFELPAGQAFGPREPQRVQWVSRALLAELGQGQEAHAVGDVVQFPTPDGRGHMAATVVGVREDGAVCFDFNHPLAGQPVRFEVQVIGVL